MSKLKKLQIRNSTAEFLVFAQNIFETPEFDEKAVCRDFRHTALDTERYAALPQLGKNWAMPTKKIQQTLSVESFQSMRLAASPLRSILSNLTQLNPRILGI